MSKPKRYTICIRNPGWPNPSIEAVEDTGGEYIRTEDCKSLEQRIEQMEQYVLSLGDLCDSPNSLRRNLAKACEVIAKKRTDENKIYPKWEGRWVEFLDKEE